PGQRTGRGTTHGAGAAHRGASGRRRAPSGKRQRGGARCARRPAGAPDRRPAGARRRPRPALLQRHGEGCQVGALALAGDRMILEISHRTGYAYTEPVLQSQHLVHLTPRQGTARAGVQQTLLRHSLLVEPAPSETLSRTDYFGNAAAMLTIEG